MYVLRKPFCNILLFVGLGSEFFAQQILPETKIDLGEISDVYEIRADLVLNNPEAKTVHLLRADSEKGIRVFTSKKSIAVNDTALLVISFIPEQEGRFNKTVLLHMGHLNKPIEIALFGAVHKIKKDDKTACYYFKKQNKPTQSVVVSGLPTEKNNTNQPVTIEKTEEKNDPERLNNITSTSPKTKNESEQLPESLFKPNNILFLVDVSNSMKDSLKLPLMKVALHKLIDALREVDKVSFLTYADSVRILAESISGKDKEALHLLVDNIKARGLTKGRQAILKSTDVLLRNYIEGGNNQILMATDGEFNFYPKDEQQFKEKQKDKTLVLTTLAFGNDKKAMQNLKDIAKKGNGSFLHIKNRKQSENILLEEIKERSRK